MNELSPVLKKHFEYKAHDVQISTTRSWGAWTWSCRIDGERSPLSGHGRHLMEASAVIEATFQARKLIDRLAHGGAKRPDGRPSPSGVRGP